MELAKFQKNPDIFFLFKKLKIKLLFDDCASFKIPNIYLIQSISTYQILVVIEKCTASKQTALRGTFKNAVRLIGVKINRFNASYSWVNQNVPFAFKQKRLQPKIDFVGGNIIAIFRNLFDHGSFQQVDYREFSIRQVDYLVEL